MTATEVRPDAVAAPPVAAGYRPPPRYRVVRGEPGTSFDGQASGSAPIEATIRSNLLGGELEWLKAAATDDEVRARMAPYIVAWNCEAPAFDPATGEVAWERLPPPAEAGPDVLARVELWTTAWLRVQLVTAPTRLGDDALGKSPPSASTPAGAGSGTAPSATAAPSPTPSRRSGGTRRTSSPTPAAST